MDALMLWLQERLDDARHVILTQVWSADTGLQAAMLLGAALAGLLAGGKLRRLIERLDARIDNRWFDALFQALRAVAVPLAIWLLFQLLPPLATQAASGDGLIKIAHTLLGAWVMIRFATAFIDYPALARWVAIIAWSLAALSILGWLDDVSAQLEAVGFTLGETRISALTVLKAGLAFAVVLWVANLLARFSENRIQQLQHLTPSLRVLISKILRVGFIVFAIVIGLNTLGIDLTSLAVFSGAVGVGLGFGLQKVVSNFISGIILLLDRSIKPGDVIAIEQTYGWVNKLSARHVSVITRDGKEHLIPNELLITERVENWSYSDRNIRLKIPIGVSYNADPRLALKLMLEAAGECPRILKSPRPNALMIGFGDSSVDLELRCWIDDPNNGIRNITSEVLLLIWDKFHEHGIEIPYPQRDVHLRSSDVALSSR